MRSGGEQLWVYNAQDCARTYEIWEAQQRVVNQMGLRMPHDFTMDLFFPLLQSILHMICSKQIQKVGF